MKIAALAVVAVGLVTCSETVRLNDKAREVEFLSHEYSGKHGYKCNEVGPIDVSMIPAEISGENGMEVLDIKFKNEARRMGATHVLKFPSKEWGCKKSGEEDPKSERQCRSQSGTAFVCMVGRGT